MLEKSENSVGLLLNLHVEINIYFQEQTARLYLWSFCICNCSTNLPFIYGLVKFKIYS